ncbi:MAG: restriction endonuclease subunit S [Nitrososphaeria archaeon]
MTSQEYEVKLGDCIETLKGFAFKSQWYTDKGVPLIKVSDFSDDSISTENITFIPEHIAKDFDRYRIRENDIIIQTVGSWPRNPKSVVGKAILVPRNCNNSLLNQNAVKIIPNRNIDNNFLFYLLRSKQFKDYIINTAQGAANQASITLESIKNFKFVLPDFDSQKKIGAQIRNYDDLIKNNSRRIQLLEHIAKLIYDEWFVRFKFPGHENIGIVESELGDIPKGWKVSKLSEVIDIDPKMAFLKNSEKVYVPMSALSPNSMLIDEFEFRRGNDGSKFKNGDTLFARITPSLEHGKTAFVQFLGPDEVALGSTEFIVFRSRTLNPYYVYFIARNENLRQHAIKSMTGASGRQRVQSSCFDSFYFPRPEEDTLTKFASIVAPMFHEIQVLCRKNQILQHMRNLLLPKLISGEINVSELDIKVPEVEA